MYMNELGTHIFSAWCFLTINANPVLLIIAMRLVRLCVFAVDLRSEDNCCVFTLLKNQDTSLITDQDTSLITDQDTSLSTHSCLLCTTRTLHVYGVCSLRELYFVIL